MIGFVKLQRSIFGSWVHQDAKLFKAWCDILSLVNYEEKEAIVGGRRLLCGVGEALYSLDSWAERFNSNRSNKDKNTPWSKQQVRQFFKKLELHNMITTSSEGRTTRLRVIFEHEKDTETNTETNTKKTRLKHSKPVSYNEEEHEVEHDSNTKRTRKRTPTKEERIKKEESSLKEKEKGLGPEPTKPEKKQKKVATKKSNEKNIKLEIYNIIGRPDFFTDSIEAVFMDYAKNRKKKRKAIKTEETLKALYKKIRLNIEENGEAHTVACIEDAVAGTWQGLFFNPNNHKDKINGTGARTEKQRATGGKRSRYSDIQQRFNGG